MTHEPHVNLQQVFHSTDATADFLSMPTTRSYDEPVSRLKLSFKFIYISNNQSERRLETKPVFKLVFYI